MHVLSVKKEDISNGKKQKQKTHSQPCECLQSSENTRVLAISGCLQPGNLLVLLKMQLHYNLLGVGSLGSKNW